MSDSIYPKKKAARGYVPVKLRPDELDLVTTKWTDLESQESSTLRIGKAAKDGNWIAVLAQRFGFENEFNAEFSLFYLAPSHLPEDGRDPINDDDIFTPDEDDEFLEYDGPEELLRIRSGLEKWKMRAVKPAERERRQARIDEFDRLHREHLDKAHECRKKVDARMDRAQHVLQQQTAMQARAAADVRAQLAREEAKERLEMQRQEQIARVEEARLLQIRKQREMEERARREKPAKRPQLSALRQRIEDEKIRRILAATPQQPATSSASDSLEMLPPRTLACRPAILAQTREKFLPPKVSQIYKPAEVVHTIRLNDSNRYVPPARGKVPVQQTFRLLAGTETVRDAVKAERKRSPEEFVGNVFNPVRQQRMEEQQRFQTQQAQRFVQQPADVRKRLGSSGTAPRIRLAPGQKAPSAFAPEHERERELSRKRVYDKIASQTSDIAQMAKAPSNNNNYWTAPQAQSGDGRHPPSNAPAEARAMKAPVRKTVLLAPPKTHTPPPPVPKAAHAPPPAVKVRLAPPTNPSVPLPSIHKIADSRSNPPLSIPNPGYSRSSSKSPPAKPLTPGPLPSINNIMEYRSYQSPAAQPASAPLPSLRNIMDHRSSMMQPAAAAQDDLMDILMSDQLFDDGRRSCDVDRSSFAPNQQQSQDDQRSPSVYYTPPDQSPQGLRGYYVHQGGVPHFATGDQAEVAK